jgi:hypothetical protein|nr:MAG TPA: hypothetical protein [Caudoviricetes sp.]
MKFENFKVTKRETLVAIAITLALIGLGIIISEAIKNNVNESNEKYYKALKINNDEEMFKYAIKTNVGYTLASGTIRAINGISIDELDGIYLSIKKVKEEYRKHYREEKHTRIKSDGTEEIYYTTEEYWTWDYVEEEKIHVDKFNFLGVDFDYDTIEFYNQSYNTTKEVEYHIRYEYYTISSEFEGTLFTYINNNTITQNKFSTNKTINEIVKSKEDDVNFINAIFWITWIIFITLIDFGYVYLENNYLED